MTGAEKPKRKASRAYRKNAISRDAAATWPCDVSVFSVAVLSYVNGCDGDFVHDDIPAVTLNKDVSASNGVGRVFANDFWGIPMADLNSHKSYRPLTTLTFRVNYLAFGLTPLWFHLTNVLLHAAACVLFARVCSRVGGLKPPFAALSGLLFAVHPVHTEAVTGIVGRADVLACVFFLTSILAYHGSSEGKHHTWISTGLGGLSMLAKETGVTVFLVNLLHDFYLHWPSLRRTLAEIRWNKESQQVAHRASRMLKSLGILLALRLAILQGSLPKFSPQDNPAAFHSSMHVRFLTYCYLTAFNWWLLICPWSLSHDWQMGSIPLVASLTDSRNLLTVFCFGMVLLLTLRSLSDLEDQKRAPIVLGLCLLVLPFLPAANIFVTVGFVVAERVLYIPSLGYILLVVYGVQLWWDNHPAQRHTLLIFVILLLASGCLRTVIRNRDWRSRESLLRSGLAVLPQNAKMHYNYANFLRDSARMELAKSHYYTALRLWPSYASAHNNLGTLLSDVSEAEKHFLAAIRHSSDHVNAHYNLGRLYRKRNRTSESEDMLKKCVILEPKFTLAYVELRKLLGPDDPKIYHLLRDALDANPNDLYYATQLARLSIKTGNYQRALHFYWKTLQASPHHQEAVYGVAKVLKKFGQKSRLFQLLTRWHSIQRTRFGEINRDIYLQEWYLKTELRNRAKVYDDNNNNYHPSYEKDAIISAMTSSSEQFKNMSNSGDDDSVEKTKSETPLMVYSLRDSL